MKTVNFQRVAILGLSLTALFTLFALSVYAYRYTNYVKEGYYSSAYLPKFSVNNGVVTNLGGCKDENGNSAGCDSCTPPPVGFSNGTYQCMAFCQQGTYHFSSNADTCWHHNTPPLVDTPGDACGTVTDGHHNYKFKWVENPGFTFPSPDGGLQNHRTPN